MLHKGSRQKSLINFQQIKCYRIHFALFVCLFKIVYMHDGNTGNCDYCKTKKISSAKYEINIHKRRHNLIVILNDVVHFYHLPTMYLLNFLFVHFHLSLLYIYKQRKQHISFHFVSFNFVTKFSKKMLG